MYGEISCVEPDDKLSVKILLERFGFRSIGQVGHFVGIAVQVIEFIDILGIPNAFVELVANGAHFKAVAALAIINTIS